LVTAANWRLFISENKHLLKYCENPKRLAVNKMSIELTHLILMSKGPKAEEFEIAEEHGESNKFGNFFTRAEYFLFNVYFFVQDSLF
jgi:hypothetical protein